MAKERKREGGGLGSLLARVGLASEVETTESPSGSMPMSPAPIIGSMPMSAGITSADPALVEKIRQRIEATLSPAFTAFRGNLEQLKPLLPDEAKRYQVAATMIKNGSPVDVVQGAQAMLAALQNEQAAFTADHNGALQRAVSSQDAVITDLDRQIAAAQDELQRLITERQAKIAELSGKKEAAAQQRQAAHDEITRQASAYAAAFTKLQTDIQAEVARITSYLTGGAR